MGQRCRKVCTRGMPIKLCDTPHQSTDRQAGCWASLFRCQWIAVKLWGQDGCSQTTGHCSTVSRYSIRSSSRSAWRGSEESPLPEHEDMNDSRCHIKKKKKSIKTPSPLPKIEIYTCKRQWGWSSGDSEIQMTQKNDRIKTALWGSS